MSADGDFCPRQTVKEKAGTGRKSRELPARHEPAELFGKTSNISIEKALYLFESGPHPDEMMAAIQWGISVGYFLI